jgi:16S rRNA processing protein RimM
MSSSESDNEDSLVTVARAVKTRGLKGEVVADLLTDFPERFESLERLIGLSPGGVRHVLEIEDYWFQNDRIVFKFVGYDTIEAGKELIGYDLCIPESDRVVLEEDEYYDFELEGCVVSDVSGNTVGTVRSILKTGGSEILVINSSDEKEVLVPLAEPIVVRIDIAGKTIVIDPPEGLLELS